MHGKILLIGQILQCMGFTVLKSLLLRQHHIWVWNSKKPIQLKLKWQANFLALTAYPTLQIFFGFSIMLANLWLTET